MPDKTDEKQGKFRKGQSGNPLGRPRGIKNKATLLVEALFEGEIEGICRKAIEEAKRKLLGSIFPAKLTFQDGKYRTDGLNPALAIILQNTKALESEKRGDTSVSENVSGNVPVIGLEPTLYC